MLCVFVRTTPNFINGDYSISNLFKKQKRGPPEYLGTQAGWVGTPAQTSGQRRPGASTPIVSDTYDMLLNYERRRGE